MPKQLINVIGIIVSAGIIALGLFLVAMPMYFQSVSTDQQTAVVESANAIYQVQVDQLRVESERQDEIDASVAELRAQIPAIPQLDGVFEVVGRAAEATGATIQEITAGQVVPFELRAGQDSQGGASVLGPSGSDEGGADPSATPSAAPVDGSTEDSSSAVTDGTASAGRQQIDFTIRVAAADMAQATAFLDALRGGPRLLNSMTVTTGREPSGTVTVRISALTYVDSEG